MWEDVVPHPPQQQTGEQWEEVSPTRQWEDVVDWKSLSKEGKKKLKKSYFEELKEKGRVEFPSKAFKSTFVKPILGIPSTAAKEAKSLASGAFQFSSDIYGAMAKGVDALAPAVAKVMGKSPDKVKGGLFHTLQKDAEHYAQKLQVGGMSGFMGDLLKAAGHAPGDIATIMSLGPWGMASYGAIMGGAEGGAKGALTGGAQGALIHGSLKGLNLLPRSQAIPAAAMTGYATTPGSQEEKLRGAIELGGLQTMMGPRKGTRQFHPLEIPDVLKKTRFYQQTFNRFVGMENLSKRVKDLGLKLLPGQDPLYLTRSWLSVKDKADYTMTHGTYEITPEGTIKVTGEGVKPALDDYVTRSSEKNIKKSHADLNTYLKSTRTLDDLYEISVEKLGDPSQPPLPFADRPKVRRRDSRTGKPIVSDAQVESANQELAGLRDKYKGDLSNLETTAGRLYDFQKRVLQKRVTSGLMTQADFDRIITTNPHYIPFDRMFGEDYGVGAVPSPKGKIWGRVFKGTAAPRTISGSELDVHDPLGSIYKHTIATLDAVDRNNVARSIADLSQMLPKEVAPVSPVLTMRDVEGFVPSEKEVARPTAIPDVNTIKYYKDGVDHEIRVSPQVHEGMMAMNEAQGKFIFNMLSKPAHWLRVGATITPEWVVKNPIRDNWDAMIMSRTGFKMFVDIPGAVADILGKSDAWLEWHRSGAAYSGVAAVSRNELKKLYKQIVKGPKFNVVTAPEDISLLMEQATRLAVYKSARAKGLSPIESGFHSAEATIDYRVKGGSKAVQGFNQLTAFFNAGLQGVDRARRAFFEDPVGFTIKAMASVTVPSLALYALNKDDPQYQELPPWRKYLFWNVKVGDTFVGIPKPFIIGQLYGSVPEGFLEYMNTKDPQVVKDVLGQLWESTSPVSGDVETGILPTMLKPLVENASPLGWNFFRQRPIVPTSREGLPPEEQYTKFTSETAKLAGKTVPGGYSPAKIENIIQGYFGGSGKYALQGADILLKGLRSLKPGQQAVEEPATLKERADMPLLRGFLSKPVYYLQSSSLERFYRNLDTVSGWQRSLREAAKAEDGNRIKEIVTAHRKELEMAPQFTKISDNISKTRKAMGEIMASKSIPDDKKRKILEDLAWEIINRAKMMNEALRKLPGYEHGGWEEIQ